MGGDFLDGKRYRELMRERGLTIRETAQAARVDPSTVKTFIYGSRVPNLTEKTIRGLCDAVGINPREWFD